MLAFSRFLQRQAGASPREMAFIALLLGFSVVAVATTVVADVTTTDETVSVR
jgi:Flp pilus assembly pilin Flp